MNSSSHFSIEITRVNPDGKALSVEQSSVETLVAEKTWFAHKVTSEGLGGLVNIELMFCLVDSVEHFKRQETVVSVSMGIEDAENLIKTLNTVVDKARKVKKALAE